MGYEYFPHQLYPLAIHNFARICILFKLFMMGKMSSKASISDGFPSASQNPP